MQVIRLDRDEQKYASMVVNDPTATFDPTAVVMNLAGPNDPPISGVVPTVIDNVSPTSARVRVLIGPQALQPASGTYWLWSKFTDSPERQWQRSNTRVRVVGPIQLTLFIVDNLDGTLTITGPTIFDNGDGTLTITGVTVDDNLDGTLNIHI